MFCFVQFNRYTRIFYLLRIEFIVGSIVHALVVVVVVAAAVAVVVVAAAAVVGWHGRPLERQT